MRQLIIVRKDLDMSPGKLASQVSHASMAFLTTMICENTRKHSKTRLRAIDDEGKPMLYMRPDLSRIAQECFERGEPYFYVKAKYESEPYGELILCENEPEYCTHFLWDTELYEQWIAGKFTKTVCVAKNKNQLLEVIDKATELGLKEGRDYFLIKDACLTTLEPEEIDENDNGYTLTCIGFKPLPDDVAHELSRKYQLYR